MMGQLMKPKKTEITGEVQFQQYAVSAGEVQFQQQPVPWKSLAYKKRGPSELIPVSVA